MSATKTIASLTIDSSLYDLVANEIAPERALIVTNSGNMLTG